MQTDNVEGQMSLFDQDIWSGRTSPEHSAATRGKTSKRSLRRSSASQSQKPPMCLCLIGGGGARVDAYTPMWVNGQLLGDYTMPSFGESPREENESRLSQILVDSAHPKYYLSAKACAGILRRKKGQKMPEELVKALERQSGLNYEGGVQRQNNDLIIIEMTSTKNTIVTDEISPTLTARMGTGGNQVNAIWRRTCAM